VVLLQRSEGGALGMGGGPTGFMTARGAGDLLTRTTWILFGAFLILSVALTLLAGRQRSESIVDRVTIDAVDPDKLYGPPATNTAPATNDAATPEPLTAPTPTIRTPMQPTTNDLTTPATPTQ
jgi:preprotein translocase subunit SecG